MHRLLLSLLVVAAATALLVALFEDVPAPDSHPGRDAGSTRRPRPADDLRGPGDLPPAGVATVDAAEAATTGRTAKDATRTAIGATELAIEVTADGAPAPVDVTVIGPSVYETLRADGAGRIVFEARPGSYEVFIPRDAASGFTPLGSASEARVEVRPGERSTVRLEAARPATLRIRVPEGHTAPGRAGLVGLHVHEGSRWVLTSLQPRVERRSATWTGLEPGRYRVHVALFGGAREEVTLASGETRTVDLDLGLRPVTVTVDARSRASGRLERVPLLASVRYGGAEDAAASNRYFGPTERVIVSGEPTVFHLPEGSMVVTLGAPLLCDFDVVDGPGRSFRARVTEVGASPVHEVAVDLPSRLALLELRFEDPRPPGERYHPTVLLPGAEEFVWLDPHGPQFLALDLARLAEGPVRVFDGPPVNDRELWTEAPRPGWTRQTIRMAR